MATRQEIQDAGGSLAFSSLTRIVPVWQGPGLSEPSRVTPGSSGEVRSQPQRTERRRRTRKGSRANADEDRFAYFSVLV
jgi:hypothetical protein